MRALLLYPGLLAAVFVHVPADAEHRLAVERAGQLEDTRLLEVSGLVASGHSEGVLWVLNDGGAAPALHATNPDGRSLGELMLDGARNRDWEDLAVMRTPRGPVLIAADVGDNAARHEYSTLYLVAEPAGPVASAVPRALRFRYPDGARDAESFAVDSDTATGYVLSKRDIPPRLYAVNLDTDTTAVQQAAFLGDITSLPPPTATDRRLAPIRKDWHWQPTAMDFSPDGTLAAILTYNAVYLYTRDEGQSWFDALNGRPQRVSVAPVQGAEALGFSADGRHLYLTVEQRNAPLFRIALDALIPRENRP